MRFSDENSGGILSGNFSISNIIKGIVCAGMVLFTGIFAVIEYLLAFLEFMLVTSVGIILFPLSLWDGSKFMAEKLIGAIVGFFIKLLFSNICIFLMLWGFISLANTYTSSPFTGTIDEIAMIGFTSFLFFYICKSAPGLAQSLLSGTPSLNAAGAIGAAAGAIGAAKNIGGAAKAAGGAAVGGATKGLFAAAGAGASAVGAAKAAKTLGGNTGSQAAAAMKSLGHSAGEAVKSGASGLARSLLGSGGKGSKGGGNGYNAHSQSQKFQNGIGADGKQVNGKNGPAMSLKQHLGERMKEGQEIGLNHMTNKEEKANAKAEKAAAKQNPNGV
jgi:type IV secretion system protein TrbL